MDKNLLAKDFNFWRQLINFLSILFFAVVVYNFFTRNSCASILSLLSTIYISILAIYVSNKEFERWYDQHKSQHPGEIFVIIWSVLIFFLVAGGFFFQRGYELPGSVISSYVAVLTILAITRKSKALYQRRRRNRPQK